MNDCPFCPMPPLGHPVTNSAYLLEPLKPVAPGHFMIIPLRHVTDFTVDPTLSGAMVSAASLIAAQMGGDWNLITSKGEAATQSVAHLHIHLVPRRANDGLHLPWTGQTP